MRPVHAAILSWRSNSTPDGAGGYSFGGFTNVPVLLLLVVRHSSVLWILTIYRPFFVLWIRPTHVVPGRHHLGFTATRCGACYQCLIQQGTIGSVFPRSPLSTHRWRNTWCKFVALPFLSSTSRQNFCVTQFHWTLRPAGDCDYTRVPFMSKRRQDFVSSPIITRARLRATIPMASPTRVSFWKYTEPIPSAI
jgi:hypothetical protein